MYKWEDEKWEKVNLQAGYSRNDRRCMETYLCVPAQRGKFHVYIEADGEFVVKHIGGDLDGSWLGNIAYDVGQRTWSVGNYKGCKITNFQTNTTFVAGHPDAEMNHKSFDSARAVEVDWFASFELSCDDDEGSWRIFPPPIQKDSSYNYTVSYANYTEKYCEWGAISISIDEDNENGSMPIRKPLKGEMQWSQPEEDLPDSQRQDYKTPDLEKSVTVTWGDDEKLTDPDLREKEDFDYSSSEDFVADDITPGTRMLGVSGEAKDFDPYLLRDRGVYTGSNIEVPGNFPTPKPIEEDPWAHVRSFAKQKGPGSVAGGSITGSLTGGVLRRPPRPPVEKVKDDPIPDFVDFGGIHTPERARTDGVLERAPTLKAKGGSTISTGSLTGGLFKSRNKGVLEGLSSEQRLEYERIKRAMGKTRAAEYLKQLEQ